MLSVCQCLQYIKDNIVDYVDIDYSLWLTWCLTPLLVTFLLPTVIALLLYISAFTLYVYKLHWRHLRSALITGDRWETARKCVSVMWDAHGWIWHGYEIHGLENLPINGPALLIYYHGAMPVDIYYFLAKICLIRNRVVHTVADYFLFKIPGFSILADCMKVVPGTVQSCSKLLKEGNYLAIAPGGVYEAQFSVNYSLMWKKRMGFAKVALDSKAPVIPVFTENLREAFRTLGLGRRLFLKLYAWTKLPFAPLYGGFPVKMVTHIGKPIYYDPNLSPEDFQKRVATALDDLIRTHQRLPGNILLSILERIPYLRRKLKVHQGKMQQKNIWKMTQTIFLKLVHQAQVSLSTVAILSVLLPRMGKTFEGVFPVTMESIKIGDWLLVEFFSQKYIRRVQSIDKNYTANFIQLEPLIKRKISSTLFVYPDIPDVTEFRFDQIIGIISAPEKDRRDILIFKVDTNKW